MPPIPICAPRQVFTIGPVDKVLSRRSGMQATRHHRLNGIQRDRRSALPVPGGLDPDNAPIQLTILHPRTRRTPPLKGLVAHYTGGLPPNRTTISTSLMMTLLPTLLCNSGRGSCRSDIDRKSVGWGKSVD